MFAGTGVEPIPTPAVVGPCARVAACPDRHYEPDLPLVGYDQRSEELVARFQPQTIEWSVGRNQMLSVVLSVAERDFMVHRLPTH